MKKLLYTIASLAALTVIACSKEQDTPDVRPEIPDTPEEVIEVPATLSGSMGDPTTKVSNDNNGAYKWQASDHVTILTNNGANREFSADEAGLTTEFSGHIPNTDALVGGFALYPASSNLEADHHSISGTTITFNIPTTLTWGADASYMPMYAPIEEDPEDAQKVKASFKAVGGAMKLICYNIPAGATTLAFTAKVNIAGNFTLDTTAEHPTLSDGETGKEIDIDFTGNYSANKVFYIPLPPVTLTGGFTISFFDSNLDEVFTQTTTAAPTIQRNHLMIAPALNCAAVLWSEDFTGYTADSQPSSKGSVTYAYGEDGTKVYTTQLASGGVEGPELLIKSGNGTFTASNIPTGNATSMTLTFMTNRNLTLSSTTDGISIGDITSDGNARSVSISNSKGASVFNIEFKNTLGNNARIDDIKLINPASTVTAPSISATDDALTIGVGESSASTTVTLANAVDNLGVSALVSGTNADKFTAAISGTTLTVTAKETNSTAADYTATVTLKASGATAKAIAVTQTTNLVPNPTLTASPESGAAIVTWAKDSHASSYVAYLHTAETETPATGGTTVTGSISTVNNNCTLSLTGLTNGTTYHVYVKVNGVAESYTPPTNYAHVAVTPVAAKELVSIALTTNPTQTTYNIGDTFSLTGAVVTATYNDSTTADVTSSCDTTYDFSTMGAKTVTISYTEGGITRTCDCNVTVAALDVLTSSWAGTTTGSSYGDWSDKAGSSSAAVYAGNSCRGVDYIQLRSTNNSGIISTTSGGVIRKITVSWNNSTQNDRTLQIYGKNNAYSNTQELYDNSNQGDLLGTIVCGKSTELSVTGDYEYVGLRSASGAMYFDEIDIKWEPGTPTIAMAKTSISGVAAAGVNNASESAVYTFKNGATDADVTVTWDETVVTSASKNNGSITYTVAANTGAARDGWIDVKYGNESAHRVTVSQNAATYTLTLSSGGNGTVAATVDDAAVASGSAVAVGKTVSITTTPFSGYQLSALSYNDGSAHDIISTKSFTMPSAAVTVSATFSAVPTISMDKTSITGVAAAGVTNASESGVYSFHNGATDADVTVTCDGIIVTAASKNNGAITYTVAANSGAARDGWIKVQYDTEDPHTVTVSQLAGAVTKDYYKLVTSVSDITAGTYVVGALRSTTATNNFYFGKASVSSGDWVVSDNYVTVADVNGVRRFEVANLPTGAVEFTLTGDNTNGFTISNGTNYLYFTTATNRKLAFAASGSSQKWSFAAKSSPLVTGGVYISAKGNQSYTISENSTAAGAIRGYANTTAYRAIYLFKKVNE